MTTVDAGAAAPTRAPRVPAPETLTYRLFAPDDLPAVQALWVEAGWGGITAEQWEKWYVRTPHGPAIVAVTVDATGAVRGQLALTPYEVWLDGRTVRAMRASAPIVAHDLRSHALRKETHPPSRMLLTAAVEARRQGVAILYATPDAAWIPYFAWLRRTKEPFLCFDTASYPLRERSLGDAAAEREGLDGLAAGACAERVTRFDEEFDALWVTAREALAGCCAVARDAHALRYRLGGHHVVGVREGDGGPLLGYAAVRARDGLLVDLLARSPALLPRVLAAALGHLADAGQMPVVKAMEAAPLREALDALGFARVPDFAFAFACNGIGPDVRADAVAPDRWYLLPTD